MAFRRTLVFLAYTLENLCIAFKMAKGKSSNPMDAFRKSLVTEYLGVHSKPLSFSSRKGAACEGIEEGEIFPLAVLLSVKSSTPSQNKETRTKAREVATLKKDVGPLEVEVRKLTAAGKRATNRKACREPARAHQLLLLVQNKQRPSTRTARPVWQSSEKK